MSLWMIALTAYFAVGLMLVFIGPAARQRRYEQLQTLAEPSFAPGPRFATNRLEIGSEETRFLVPPTSRLYPPH
jgi:hypothetical protein